MLLRKPTDRLTAATYWNALAERIDRMVAREAAEDARYILRQVERNEPNLNVEQNVGAALIRSEWLTGAITFPAEGVPAEQLVHEPETLDVLRDDDNLERFVAELYHYPDY